MKLEPYEVKVPEGRESEGYVYLRHNTQYTILLTNLADTRCDAEVRIDGREVGAWRVPALKTVVIERPVHDTGRFTFYEVGSREADKAGISESDQLGLLTVVFKPEKINWTLNANPQPLTRGGLAGGTGLSGQSKQEFSEAAPIEYDLPQAVTIHLRLVGEPDEPRPMFQRETAVPPPVAPRGGDRQVNQSLTSDSTEHSGGFAHLPIAEDQSELRRQALPPKHSLPPPLPPPLPRIPQPSIRHVGKTSGRFTQDELLKVVSHRDNIITVYLLALVAACLIPNFISSILVLLFFQIALWTGIGIAFYLLADAMKEENAWWAFVAAFIPFVNLFMVFRLRGKATALLKNYGITITKVYQMRNQIRRMAA